MHINTIRTLNLIGTILFGIFGILMSLYYTLIFSSFFFWGMTNGNLVANCMVIFLICAIIILFLTYLLYSKTVKSLDIMDYETAKRWMIVGIVLGFIFGGIIVFIIFLISFVMFDDAIRGTHYPYYPPPYYPPPVYWYPPPDYPGKNGKPFSYDYPYPHEVHDSDYHRERKVETKRSKRRKNID